LFRVRLVFHHRDYFIFRKKVRHYYQLKKLVGLARHLIRRTEDGGVSYDPKDPPDGAEYQCLRVCGDSIFDFDLGTHFSLSPNIGVCHRDISLENILLDDNDQVVIIDPGMSLRVPYSDPSNYGCVTDASAGTCRRLMKNQGQGGKLMYAAPEVIEREEVFDGFALDLFGAGVVLFVMLVGLAPFKWAHPSDKRYARIAKGGLKELLSNLEIAVSDEACDLLQGMFWRNPRKRSTLAEVMEHPWVIGRTRTGKSIEPTNSGKKFTFNETKHQKNPSTSSSTNSQRSCDKQKVRFGAGLNASRSIVAPNF
jgi:serine/threonine protein kinase